MSVRSRAALADAPVQVSKVFGPNVPPGLVAAEAQAHMTQASPFSPGTPIGPYDGYSRTPRSQNFVTGVNISTRPRTHERVSFDTLVGLINAYDIAQIAIWHRIDSIRSLDWHLIAAPHFQGDATGAIEIGMKALKRPDRINSFSSWLAKWLFDVLAYDAGALYRLRNRAGRCIGLLPVDGTTIAPLLDYWGNPPGAMNAPDDPLPEAFVQYVNGIPWNWLTLDDLIYQPFRPRTNSPYGHAPLESIILNANTDIRFQLYFLQRFTEGNLPAAFASAPETWSPDQIEQWQEYWDGFVYGDQSRKHQIRWMPGGTKFAWSNEKDFSDTFSLFLMRKTLAAYHTVPADLGFTESVNRSSGESQADVQHRVGELPLDAYVEAILTDFLQNDLGLPVDFEFDKGEEQDDRLAVAQADEIYMRNAVIGSSEIREMRFGLPEPDGQVVPRGFFTERSGLIPLNSVLAVAGPIDPATAAPEPGAELPRTVFGGTEGVLPNPPIKVPSLAEQEFGPAAMPPAPPPQPKMTAADATPELGAGTAPVVKDGDAPAAPAAGITAATGIYGYDGPGHDDDDEPGLVDQTAVAKEMQAFRRYSRARRRSGEWRDFEFRAVTAGEARRLNAGGRAAVAKADPPGLTKRSGMISLDLPEGAIEPLPGGIEDFHCTVVYLGPDVSDEAFAAACERARQAAELAPGPLDATVSGVGAFPPSASSDGKVPAWAAIAVPGAERIREALADLSASEHRDWQPHVTLAYLEPGAPLPAPLEPVQVTFACLSVHRGDEVVRIPLGGDAVAKAGGASPKGRAWHGWSLDEKTARHWAPQVRDSVRAALPKAPARDLGRDYLAAHKAQDGGAPGKRDRNAAASAWVLAWLASHGITLIPASMAEAIAVDGYAIGANSARHQVTGDPPGAQKPGDTSSALDRVEEAGLAAALALLLHGGNGQDPAGEAVAGRIAGGYARALAIILAGTDADWADSQDTLDDLGDLLSEALADEDTAVTLVGTEITFYTGAAAQDYYFANSITEMNWVTNPSPSGVCPVCLANEAASPQPNGQPWPSGDLGPPIHPHCFPAGVMVAGPSVVAATARRYEGDLVTIVFADGEEVPVTPNHPVLTPDGWVAAGDLREGREVLRAADVERVALLVCPDDRQAVARIEDVAGTLAESRACRSDLVPLAAEDFHGDGSGDDYVDVVRAAGDPVCDVKPGVCQHRPQLGFQGAEGVRGLADGSGGALFVGDGAPPRSLMGADEHGAPLSLGRPLPSQAHRGRAVAAVDAGLAEHPIDGVPVDAVLRRGGLDGHAAEVVVDKSGRGGLSPGVRGLDVAKRDAALDEALAECLAADAAHGRAVGDGLAADVGADSGLNGVGVGGLVAQRDAGSADVILDGVPVDAGNGRALAESLAGLVCLQRVSELRRVDNWSGHVYNLETAGGWYFANGIIAHNCRCALLPAWL